MPRRNKDLFPSLFLSLLFFFDFIFKCSALQRGFDFCTEALQKTGLAAKLKYTIIFGVKNAGGSVFTF